MSSLSEDYSVLLWGFEKSGNGDFSYRLYNKGTNSNHYVKLYDYYYYFIDNKSDATPLYFIRSPYNIDGYMVSASPDFKQNMWYISYYSGVVGKNGYYLYDSGSDPLSLQSVSNTTTKDTGYDLSSFRFLTYDDLWNMYTQLKSNSADGKSLVGGYTLSSDVSYVVADNRQPADYVTLINAIRTFADAKRYKPLFSDEKTGAERQTSITNAIGSPLVIKSRRFGTYLARKRNGSLYLSKSIDKDCAWTLVSTLDENGNDRYALMSMSNLDNTTNPYLTIGGADEKHAYIDFAAASDCNPKYCSLISNDHTKKLISFYPGTVPVPTTDNGYGQYEENITSSSTNTENVDNLPADWVICSDWKLIRYDETNNEHVSLTDDQLYSLVSNVTTSPTKIPFFRIENVAYSQMNRGAGWISDVDHRDELGSNRFLACKDDKNEQPVLTNMPLIDITSTTESKAWAPNLWRFELVRKGTGNPKDMPIGIVSATPHNLYKIKNANSGKYVCWPNNNGSLTAGYFTLKKDPTEAQIAYFWLDDLGNGEYALALRNPGINYKLNYSDGDPVGYAVIKSSNTVNLISKSDNKEVSFDIGPYTAGLYLETSTTVPTAESTGAFSIEQAFTIEAFTGDDNDAGTPTRRYVTAYYPFAIAPADPDVSLYTVHWSRADHSHVGFTKVDYLPANTGGIAFAPYKNDGSEVFTFRLNPDVNSSDQPTSLLTGVTEAENLWFNQNALGNETYTSDTTDPRYNYLVFSSWAYGNGHTTDGQGTTLGLFAPVDAYPMTNRGFIDVSKDGVYKKLLPQKAGGAKGALVNLDYDDVPTYLNRVLQPHAVTDDAWYDLQGHMTWFPTHGIYIHKGRKVLIK